MLINCRTHETIYPYYPQELCWYSPFRARSNSSCGLCFRCDLTGMWQNLPYKGSLTE